MEQSADFLANLKEDIKIDATFTVKQLKNSLRDSKNLRRTRENSQFVSNNKNNVAAWVYLNKISFLFIKSGIRQVKFIDKCQCYLIKLFGGRRLATGVQKLNEL